MQKSILHKYSKQKIKKKKKQKFNTNITFKHYNLTDKKQTISKLCVAQKKKKKNNNTI